MDCPREISSRPPIPALENRGNVKTCGQWIDKMMTWMKSNEANTDLLKYFRDHIFFGTFKSVLNKPKQNHRWSVDRENEEQMTQIFESLISSSAADIKLAKEIVNEKIPNGWEWFVRKNCENITSGQYGVNPNMKFGKTCHEATLDQLNQFRQSNGVLTLRKTYYFLAMVRQGIAQDTDSINSHEFGLLKKEDECSLYHTEFKAGFSSYLKKIKLTLLNQIQHQQPLVTQLTPFYQAIKGICSNVDDNHNYLFNQEEFKKYQVYNLEKEDYQRSQFYIVTYEGRVCYLLTLHAYQDCEDEGEYSILNRVSLSEEGRKINHFFQVGNEKEIIEQAPPFVQHIQHCPNQNIYQHMERADFLFNCLMNPFTKFTSKNEILNQIAELHWFLANMMLTERGNAAISEMLIDALLLYHGFMVTPYKEGIIGDMEALTTSKSQFLVNFRSFREVDLMTSVSPFERELIKRLGGIDHFKNLPLFTDLPKNFISSTGYLQGITNQSMKKPIMQFTDELRRHFILVKSSFSSNDEPHLFFQRFTGMEEWLYISPMGVMINKLEQMPMYLFSNMEEENKTSRDVDSST